ncbi:hypothetical protein Clacol_001033 [Clathrus columnatus]|uniref:Uncharacterized protein n=1 Tax=Clathrus columnatus TaxID=1419009 RepID=A0AAV5A0B6_9AGAM|nr:hypothetical protein Clacol_001033 [Clathrus columnatus]
MLSYSNIDQVMRHISSSDPEKLQEEEKYHIRDRADALSKKWEHSSLEYFRSLSWDGLPDHDDQ